MECASLWFLVSPHDRERVVAAVRDRCGQMPESQFQEEYSAVRERRKREPIVIVQTATTYCSTALQFQGVEVYKEVRQGLVSLEEVYFWSMDGDRLPQSMTWVQGDHFLDDEGMARLLLPPSS